MANFDEHNYQRALKRNIFRATDYEQHLTLLAIITTLQTVLPKSISSGKIFDIHSC